MKAIIWTLLVSAVVSLTKADSNITAEASNDKGLVSSINQNEPNKAACFPLCFPDMGKRDDLSRAKQDVSQRAEDLMQDERSATEIYKLHPKFRRWLGDRSSSSWRSLRLSTEKRQHRLRTERTWKRTGLHSSQSEIKRMTSSKSGDRHQLSRANLI